MTCQTLTIPRGSSYTYEYTVRDRYGALRPFATGEYAVLSIGTLSATGSALLQLDTSDPDEGSTTVGSPVATFYFVAADTDTTLPGTTYTADVWIGGAEASPFRALDLVDVTIQGRVNPTPPGPGP